jgi:hypothetical protein
MIYFHELSDETMVDDINVNFVLNPLVYDNNENNESQTESPTKIIKDERWWQILIQVSIPFFIAGIGTIAAGVILGNVEVRKVI